jgi:hypothetical protein
MRYNFKLHVRQTEPGERSDEVMQETIVKYVEKLQK